MGGIAIRGSYFTMKHFFQGWFASTYSVLADDLLLFAEANTQQAEVLHTVLLDYYHSSGQKISMETLERFVLRMSARN